MERIRNIKAIVSAVMIAVIRIYQKTVSPFTGSRCRFYPSCSEYFIESLKQKGPVAGTIKGAYRIIRCNPFNPGGYDPVK